MIYITYCKCCGQKIENYYSEKKFCSNECRYKTVKRPKGVKRETFELTCKYCNEKFISKISNQIFCSKKHKEQYFKEILKEKSCPTCNKIFKPKRKEQQFCSIKCSKPRTNEYFNCICKICDNVFEARYNDATICYQCSTNIKMNPVTNKCAKWHGKWCEYNGIKVMSTYELRACNILDKLVKQGKIYKWEYTKDKIKYIGLDSKKHNYILDFKIYINETNFYYLEIKGVKRKVDDIKWQAVKNNGFDLKIWFLYDIEEFEHNLNIFKGDIKQLFNNCIIKRVK